MTSVGPDGWTLTCLEKSYPAQYSTAFLQKNLSKTEKSKKSCVFRWIEFLVLTRIKKGKFDCWLFFVVVPHAPVYRVLSRLKGNFEIFNNPVVIYLVTEFGRAGRKNIWLSLRLVHTSWPRAIYFPIRSSYSVNEYILLFPRSRVELCSFTLLFHTILTCKGTETHHGIIF